MNLPRRLAWSAVVVWAVISLAFVVNQLLPGDPARMAAGIQARPADVARIREQLGLGRAPFVQYALFWKRLVHVGPNHPRQEADGGGPHATCVVVVPLGPVAVHVDLGKSFQYRQPVVDLLAARVPRTITLAFAGMALQVLLGVGAGVLAAVRRGSWVDRLLVGATLAGTSVPTFLIALFLQYVLAYRLRVLPLDGFGQTFAEHARCLVLPALTLGFYGAAAYARLARDEMATVLAQDWVRTARAKGQSEARVVLAHGLRNALVPLTTAIGLDLGSLMGGAIVTETVFRWPGLGELSLRATLNRDGPVLMACVVVTSLAIVISNLVADLACLRLDPTQR